MAEVIANQSTNVVSNNKSDVCEMKSNSVLIDFEKITASSSQLIPPACDNNDEEKCVSNNNADNEMNINEKSLQELIENELVLRICSNNECGTTELMNSRNYENDGTIDDEKPISPLMDICIPMGADFPSINVNFIKKEIEYCNVSHEFSTNQEPNSGKSINHNNSMCKIFDAEKPASSSTDAYSHDIVDDVGDASNKFAASKSIDTDKIIDEFLVMDTELTTTAERNLTCSLESESTTGRGTRESEIDQHTMDNSSLKSEFDICSIDSFDQKLSNIHNNTKKTIELLDHAAGSSNDLDIVRPLLLSETVESQSIKAVMDGSPDSHLNTQDILICMNNDMSKEIEILINYDEHQNQRLLQNQYDTISDRNIQTNDNIIMTDEYAEVILSSSNLQTIKMSDTELQKINENVDKNNVQLEDVTSIIDATTKSDTKVTAIINETNTPTKVIRTSVREKCMPCAIPVVQQAIPDSLNCNDIFHAFDRDTREELVSVSSTIISSTVKNSVKLKKKKIDGIVGNDGLPASTPRTKKTKKIKKNDLEKENISVNSNTDDMGTNTSNNGDYLKLGGIGNVDDLSNVNVKSLTQCYATVCTKHGMQDACRKEIVATGVSIDLLKSSFNKFDALSKKSILNVCSLETPKIQQSNLVAQNTDTNPNCRSCDKVVFQMEQTKAEGLIWHKNCFRCVQCSKQLSVDNYQSHELILYCKAHFKELFQPKPVDESNQPVCPRKPEMIIRENQPKELPPDVVRACDKPDLGLDELASLNVKSRFHVFEKKTDSEVASDIERSASQISVKRSPSILSKLARFQAKGMDIGVADESLNGIPYEESSESNEEEEIEEIEDVDSEIIKSTRTTRERPISFTKMDDIKNRWEVTSQQGKRESQREARKEEIAGIRSRLFMGKQGKMKEMYQLAVATSERVTKITPLEEIQCSTHARSIKEKFERGELVADPDNPDENKVKQETPDEDVIAAGISRKSRTIFLELDASAAKAGGGPPVIPVNSKTPTDTSRRARDVSSDVVRSTDTTEEIQVETSDISNKFKFFETYKEPEQQRKQFRITPPRDGQVKMNSPEREIYRDPDVIRADDRPNEMVHTDTTKKMLSIFRQMEEKATKEDVPDGPKPLKRFTPPPEDKYAKTTATDSEDEGEEDDAESGADSGGEERDPNYVRASDKVEDEFLKHAQNAAKAKTLRAKFEQWESNDEKMAGYNVSTEIEMAQTTCGEHTTVESARSLRDRFESLGAQPLEVPRITKCKVNRFVEHQTLAKDTCVTCHKKVYPLEKVETNKKIFHKHCFRCLQCNCILRMDTFTLNNGKLYCIPHFKQLFIARGNYDEGFGVDPHKNKWGANSNVKSSTEVIPIVIANGETSQMINHD